MLRLIKSFIALFLLPFTAFGSSSIPAGITTSAGVTTGADSRFTAIPEAIRQVYSREVLYQALPNLRFSQFAKIKTDLLAVRGKSISFTKYLNLGGGGNLNENALLSATGISTAEVLIPVSEVGNAISLTELSLRTSLLDLLSQATNLLAANMAIFLDGQFRDTLLTTPNVVYGGTTAKTYTTLANGDGLSSYCIKNAVETLATNNAPRILGQYYVCVAHPHQLRQLRDDSNWINTQAYRGEGRNLFIGEVGMYEGVIFLDSTQMPSMNTAAVVTKYGSGYTASNGYEAVFFGDNAYAWAIALPPEIRDDGVTNYGRFVGLAWYGIWGTGLLETKNVVKALTA